VASVITMQQMMFQQATNFNQCLSTWAGKTIPNVNVNKIFLNTGISGCPDKDPVAYIAPWCQGADEQCFEPNRTSSS